MVLADLINITPLFANNIVSICVLVLSIDMEKKSSGHFQPSEIWGENEVK